MLIYSYLCMNNSNETKMPKIVYDAEIILIRADVGPIFLTRPNPTH